MLKMMSILNLNCCYKKDMKSINLIQINKVVEVDDEFEFDEFEDA
jgi:hypothetical protein